MNIRIANFIGSHDNHQEKKQQLSLQIGLLSSALEHAVPEQMFNDPNSAVKPEAVSAVKALQKAAKQGQRIYHLTAANKASALPIFIMIQPPWPKSTLRCSWVKR